MDRLKTYKIIIIGDPAVGKTSLRKRYMGQGFKKTYQITIGADFTVKRMIFEDQQYIFQIWDLSAQVAFKSIRTIYYRNTDGIILVFDLTSETSLENITKWVTEFRQSTNIQKIPAILVGNKSDLIKTEKIDFERIENIKGKIQSTFIPGIEFIPTSALNANNVDEAFTKMIQMLIGLPNNL